MSLLAFLTAIKSSACEESPRCELTKPTLTFSKSPTSVVEGTEYFGAEGGRRSKYQRKKVCRKLKGFSDIGFDDGWVLSSPEQTFQQNTEPLESKINAPEDFKRLGDRKLKSFWQDETEKAALENREPKYLPLILEALEERLNIFTIKKEEDLVTREDLTMHAYSLMVVMRKYYSSARYVVESSIGSASRLSSEFSNNEAVWRAFKSAAWSSIDWSSRWDFEFASDTSVDWFTGWNLDVSLDWNTTDSALWSEARDATGTAVWLTIQSAKNRAKLDKDLGRFVYHVAEKVSLLHFLKNFDAIVEDFYIASSKLIFDSENNIFSSEEEWFKIKNYFELASDDVMPFLRPWWKELCRIKAKIKELEEIKELEKEFVY